MPSTLRCVLLFEKSRIFICIGRRKFPSNRVKTGKKLLTRGTRLENGPLPQGVLQRFDQIVASI
jgi:hypothetical protein